MIQKCILLPGSAEDLVFFNIATVTRSGYNKSCCYFTQEVLVSPLVILKQFVLTK